MQRKPAHLISGARRLRREATDVEALLWSDLRGGRLNGFRFARQHPIDRFVVDFACRTHRLIVELDGSQHAESEYDGRRTATLNAAGWSVLRFWNEEVLRERQAVCETILAVLDGRLSEACDGAGLIHGLRFAPVRPSPGSLREPPSPGTGEGVAPRLEAVEPLPSSLAEAPEPPPSPVPGEGPGRRMRASKGVGAEGRRP